VKVIHFCLSCFYIDGRSYQENELVRHHVKGGNDVLVVASTENHDEKAQVTYVEPCRYIGGDGAAVIRLPYRGWPHVIARKLRIYPDVRKILDEFQPNVIVFHGVTAWELLTVAKYKRDYPEVTLYVDAHESAQGSARSFVSREMLHKRWYAPIVRKAINDIPMVLGVSIDIMDFVHETYGVPREQLEFFPLAGDPLADEDIASRGKMTRAMMGISKDTILFVQSGKQNYRKKLDQTLRAFGTTANSNFRLLIVGRVFDDVRDEVEPLIAADPRVEVLGWKTPEELTDILCAADVYVQPGTQSASMQNSLCCGCAIIIADINSHQPYHVENGWLCDSEESLKTIFADIEANPSQLGEMGRESAALARKMLDYSVQAERLLQPNN